MILDAVHILFMLPLAQVTPKTFTMKGKDLEFITDAFEMPNVGTQKTLQNPQFLNMLINFSKNDKDNINEETIELLEPYLELKQQDGNQAFSPDIAKSASNALKGMCIWAAAMSDYHKQSKIVKPKLK